MSERGPGSSDTIATTGASETPRQPKPDLAVAETVPASSTSGAIAANQLVGRFTIINLLGSGGMGQVYAARDPELDRLVAIKLLRPELSIRADARLRREARAMARLSHPHLVTVHEVGVHQGQLFVAMELIDGQTLRRWARGKSWREIIRVYLAAGRGLAAAHEAGIVHRDFKPDNVLVGDDGRVAVSDFGLARTEEEDEPAGDQPAVVIDERLTQAGALLGTLRYMAPEQLERRVADARSDQFAFCVSLWEALDDHPFDTVETASDPSSADARRDAMGAGLSRRRLRGVPRQIGRALGRGLAIDPAARWPAMPALLDELDAAVARRGKLVIGGTMLGMVTIAIAATWFLREPEADPCGHVADEITATWRTGAVGRLVSAFETTHRPSAHDAATRVADLLDRRTAEWIAMRVETCVAGKSKGDQLAELHDRQIKCLDAKLHEVNALVGALTSQPTAEIVEHAVRVTTNLAPIADCGNVGALLSQPSPPRDPITESRIDLLDARVAKAQAHERLAGSLTPAELAELEQEAAALKWDPLIAKVAYLSGLAAYRRGDATIAEAKFRQAALVAARAHEDVAVGRASAYVASVLVDAGRPREALEMARAAEVASARAGDPPSLKADVLTALGDVYTALAQFDDADRAYGQAVELLETSESNPLDLADMMNSWANELYERSDFARSVPLSNRAVEMERRLLGEHHPDYARVLHSNGNEQLAIRDYKLAMARFEEALAIKIANYGQGDSTVAMTLHSIGNVYGGMGELERAAASYQRALDIWLAKSGPDSANALMARYSLGVNLRERGKLKEALATLDEVLARRKAAREPAPVKIANTLDAIASVYSDLGDRARSIELAEQALAIREKTLGPETSDVAESLARLANLWADAGDCAKARPAARRALAIAEKQPTSKGGPTASLAACDAHDGKRDDAIAGFRKAIELLAGTAEAEDRADARLALATVLWSTDRAAARELATTAVGELGAKPDRAKKWLAAHSAR